MRASEHSQRAHGVVVPYLDDRAEPVAEHERLSLLGFASRLAVLLGYEDGGLDATTMKYPGHRYFVPCDTLTSAQAAALGIRGADDLFGGVVPHAFVATKAISHALVRPDAAAVPGWNPAFAELVQGVVLAGHTVFDLDDARIAAARLLARGPVRLKVASAKGGHGQSVHGDLGSLQAMLDKLDVDEIAAHGLVLEEDLQELSTFSAGQVKVGNVTTSYVGTQRSTLNNRGVPVFGGSDLTFVRGGFDAVAADAPTPQMRQAVEQAKRFHDAAHECYPGLYASRANYDVLFGRDATGNLRSAVLEQSWRVGGATGPEIAALEAFRADPSRRRVRASSFELFGETAPPPSQAIVYFRGVDSRAGPLTKYTLILNDDDPR